eukprot:TRINITY_DN13555_c0_g1_i1.p1 TRINITY_DN13555_c0_g1~~TRINITY_DN13555_c0_g1_i1.p1  ORF type:complete len:261 (+),score=44.81 TRINITY_DN13555_c0_g1_i1:59-841(+)
MDVFWYSEYFLVWDPVVIIDLRCKYRIVGNLIGSMPHFQQQNVFNGIPLLLCEEEVALLLRLGVIRLLKGDVPFPLPTKEQVDEFERNREEDKTKQMEEILNEKRSLNLKFSKHVERKRKEDAEEIDQEKNMIDSAKGNESISVISFSDRNLQVCTDSFQYPNNSEEERKMIVFEDLWKKGYFLSNGSKFGGDFLVYPGDTLQYHAHFVVIIKGFEEELSPLDIISYGRLGVTVKKTPILASVSEDNRVVYLSLDWQGVT